MSRTEYTRLGRPQDIEGVAQIVSAWPSHFVNTATMYIQRDFSEQQSAIFEEGGRAIGFIVWSSTALDIEVLWVAVHPLHVRKGVGTKLVDYVLSRRTTQMNVLVKTATEDSVIPGTEFDGSAYAGTDLFFRSQGFERICRITSYWGPENHCYLMHRRVTLHE